MLQDLSLNLFYAFVAELFFIIVAAKVKDNLRKRFTIVLLGTFIAGIIGYGNAILARIGISSYTNNECKAWNLSFDFRTYPNQENPNRDSCGNKDVWYFLESSTLDRISANYSILQNFVADAFAIPGYQQWQGNHTWPNRQNIYFPSIGINTTDQTKTIETAIHPSRSIAVHPFDSQSLVIIGWKSPITNVVSISGFVNDLDNHGGDGILWFIDKGNQNLASGTIGDGGEQAFLDVADSQNLRDTSVSKGEFIYFIVHPNQNDEYDTTQIDIQIRIP
jgi:hypothetical protein